MIILTNKLFSGQEPIDISHLSPGAQKEIIKRERKKIELDHKISDTKDSLEKSRSRASMSLADNAKLGAYEMRKNPAASLGSSVGGIMLSGKIAEAASKATSAMGIGGGLSEAAIITARMAGSSLGPIISDTAGKAVGTIKGLTAGRAVARKEKKLARLTKKRNRMN